MEARSIERILVTSDFGKSFRRLPRHVQDLLARKEEWFKANPFDPRLRTHRLHGRLQDYWAYSVNRQYRVLFRFASLRVVVYYDVGTHGVYK